MATAMMILSGTLVVGVVAWILHCHWQETYGENHF